MSASRRYEFKPRLALLLGLALTGLALAPVASGATPVDTVAATGSGGEFGEYSNININAQSGSSGENPSGTGSFTIFSFHVSGPVTCLRVSGPDQGAGTTGSPTTAVLNIQDPSNGIVTVVLTDNGGNGTDVINAQPLGRAFNDCSPAAPLFAATLTSGRAVVFDAPLLPTSKEQCKKGGFRNYTQFKNQGDCVSFVETHGKNQPG